MMFGRRVRIGVTIRILCVANGPFDAPAAAQQSRRCVFNLDTILANKAHSRHGMIHNTISKNIKLLNVSGLTGPSTGSILIAV